MNIYEWENLSLKIGLESSLAHENIKLEARIRAMRVLWCLDSHFLTSFGWEEKLLSIVQTLIKMQIPPNKFHVVSLTKQLTCRIGDEYLTLQISPMIINKSISEIDNKFFQIDFLVIRFSHQETFSGFSPLNFSNHVRREL